MSQAMIRWEHAGVLVITVATGASATRMASQIKLVVANNLKTKGAKKAKKYTPEMWEKFLAKGEIFHTLHVFRGHLHPIVGGEITRPESPEALAKFAAEDHKAYRESRKRIPNPDRTRRTKRAKRP